MNLPTWAERHLRQTYGEHLHLVSVTPVQERRRQAYVVHTSHGAVYLEKTRMGEPRTWLARAPRPVFAFRCLQCGHRQDLIEPDAPRRIWCGDCGRPYDLLLSRDQYHAVPHGWKPFTDDATIEAPAATPAAKADPAPVPKPAEGPFTYGKYTLYTRDVKLKGGGTQAFYFFARNKPKSGRPCSMPAGYEVGTSKRTTMPYLQKTGHVTKSEDGQASQCAALTAAGKQCRRNARDGSKYCASHKGYQPPSLDKVLRDHDTAPTSDVPDTLPGHAGRGEGQCAALTAAGQQCRRSSRAGSKYCATHKGTRQRQGRVVALLDTKPADRKAKDTPPAVRRVKA